MTGDGDPLDQLIDRVLDAAPEQRHRVVAEISGGDPAREAELQALLQEYDRGLPLLERPAAERFATLLLREPAAWPASLTDRYTMVRVVGQGGMATVYLARDLKHGREVAVKIMHPDLAAALGRPRFLREIGIAAGLRHPNIEPLFDSGEVDGSLFYVMPYEGGRSLRDRLGQEPRLTIEESLVILQDVCDGLAFAHQHGVIHRDVKPDNVLLAGGRAIITDFGVARAISAASDDVLTTSAGRVGTPAYMAPEQRDVGFDPRLDVYALGILAFELLAGQRPFGDGSGLDQRATQETVAARLAAVRPDLPGSLTQCVARCLASRPEDRYPDARAVQAALRGARPTALPWFPDRRVIIAAGLAAVLALSAALYALLRPGPAPSQPPAPRLAVTVFHHEQPELEALAMGLTDQLIGALGSVPGLEVRSLAAVRPWRDSVIPPDDLARRLDVGWLVGGRLYLVDGRRVASVELTEAPSGRLIARTEATAAAGEDVRLIETVVNQVAILLREKVGEQLRLQAWRAGTRSDVAFRALHRAQQEREEASRLAALRDVPGAWNRLRRADGWLDSAARADSRWAEPWILRGLVSLQTARTLFGSGHAPDSVAGSLRTGIAHLEQAVDREPENPRAREVLGLLWHEAAARTTTGDSAAAWDARAEALLREVSEADTTLVESLSVLSDIHFDRGEFEQAYLLAERAWRADAFHRSPEEVLSRLFSYSFEAEEDLAADRWCRAYAARLPDDWYQSSCRLSLMAWSRAVPSQPDSALAIADYGTALAPRVIRSVVSAQLHTLAAAALAAGGRAGDARRVLGDVRAALTSDPVAAREPFGTDLLRMEAEVRLLLGERDSARGLIREVLKRRPEGEQRLLSSRRLRDLGLR